MSMSVGAIAKWCRRTLSTVGRDGPGISVPGLCCVRKYEEQVRVEKAANQ